MEGFQHKHPTRTLPKRIWLTHGFIYICKYPYIYTYIHIYIYTYIYIYIYIYNWKNFRHNSSPSHRWENRCTERRIIFYCFCFIMSSWVLYLHTFYPSLFRSFPILPNSLSNSWCLIISLMHIYICIIPIIYQSIYLPIYHLFISHPSYWLHLVLLVFCWRLDTG